MGTGKRFTFKMQLKMSLHVAFRGEHFTALHTSVLSLHFRMCFNVLLVEITIFEFSAANITFKYGHLSGTGQISFKGMVILLTLDHCFRQDIQF